MSSAPPPAEFCSDAELGYARSRTRFEPGQGLRLDEGYRLAHLPLVAPDHPGVIPSKDGTFYGMGHHPRVVSLVVPVPGDLLERSEAYQVMLAELRAAPFAAKIAWDLLDRRRAKLHATICGSLAIGEDAPALDDMARRALAAFAPLNFELRGLFSGNVNVGRLYLRAYTQRRSGGNVVQQVQRALGRRETDLYVVGLLNLTDDLDPTEAQALAALVDRWWDRPLLRFTADRLWLLASRDDLVLDSRIEEVIRLG